EERLAANSVAWSSGRLVQIVGASLAGGLIAWAGTTPAFLANAASFAFSAAMIARLRIPPRSGLARAGGFRAWLGDAGEGLAYARHDPFVALFVPYVIRGLGDIALGLVVGWPWALVILFIYGLNTSTGMVASTTILQTVIPERVRGRVFTLLDVTWAAMRLLSLGLGGLLADR